MPCNPDLLREIPLFSLLDSEERAVLAEQVELKNFAARQRIYKQGEPGGRGYVLVSGAVRVTTIDEDNQEVLVEEPAAAISSASLRCSTERRTRPTRRRRKIQCASRWTTTTFWR